MDYVLDTNIIDSLLNKDLKTIQKFQTAVANGETVNINGISYFEKKRGFLGIRATKKLQIFENFCKKFGILLLDDLTMYEKASEIHADLTQKGQIIPEADILIASIALINNITLVTRDGHFNRITGLNIEDWK